MEHICVPCYELPLKSYFSVVYLFHMGTNGNFVIIFVIYYYYYFVIYLEFDYHGMLMIVIYFLYSL